MKRKTIMTLLFALVMVVLSACSCNGGTTASPTPMPTSSVVTTPMPSPTMSAEVTPDMSASPLPEGTPGAATTDVASLVMEVEKLSEVKKACVAVCDNKALVGITFDDQYQGTLTQRIDDMISEKLKAVDAALTEVMVTADPTLVTEIDQLATMLKGKTEITQTERDQFDALCKKVEPVT